MEPDPPGLGAGTLQSSARSADTYMGLDAAQNSLSPLPALQSGVPTPASRGHRGGCGTVSQPTGAQHTLLLLFRPVPALPGPAAGKVRAESPNHFFPLDLSCRGRKQKTWEMTGNFLPWPGTQALTCPRAACGCGLTQAQDVSGRPLTLFLSPAIFDFIASAEFSLGSSGPCSGRGIFFFWSQADSLRAALINLGAGILMCCLLIEYS